jgi:hypothetical protein
MKELIPSIKQIGHLLGNGIIKDNPRVMRGFLVRINREREEGQATSRLGISLTINIFNSLHKINLRLS